MADSNLPTAKQNDEQHTLSQDEIAAIQEAFSFFDKDGDGNIRTVELGPLLRTLGYNPEEVEITKCAEQFDDDGSGTLDFPEFLGLLTQYQWSQDCTEDDMEEAFRVFDKEGNGMISTANLRHIMTNMGEKLTDEQVKEMLDCAAPENQEEINYKDFIKLLLSDQEK